jgi:TonB family protein
MVRFLLISSALHLPFLLGLLLQGPINISARPQVVAIELVDSLRVPGVRPRGPQLLPSPQSQSLNHSPTAMTEASGQGPDSGSGVSRYLARLRELIDQQKIYPAIARAHHQQGRVEVSFKLNSMGEFSNIHIQSPSAFPILNAAALHSVEQVGHFEPAPTEMAMSDLVLVLPVVFRLN